MDAGPPFASTAVTAPCVMYVCAPICATNMAVMMESLERKLKRWRACERIRYPRTHPWNTSTCHKSSARPATNTKSEKARAL